MQWCFCCTCLLVSLNPLTGGFLHQQRRKPKMFETFHWVFTGSLQRMTLITWSEKGGFPRTLFIPLWCYFYWLERHSYSPLLRAYPWHKSHFPHGSSRPEGTPLNLVMNTLAIWYALRRPCSWVAWVETLDKLKVNGLKCWVSTRSGGVNGSWKILWSCITFDWQETETGSSQCIFQDIFKSNTFLHWDCKKNCCWKWSFCWED